MTGDRMGRAGPSPQYCLARGTAVLVKTGLGVNFILPVAGTPSLQSAGVKAQLDPANQNVILDLMDPLP